MGYALPPDIRAAGTTPARLRDLLYVPKFLAKSEADSLLEHCLRDLSWQQERFMLFGKLVTAPRLTAWYGEAGTAYRYSGVTRAGNTWTPMLRRIANLVGQRLTTSFNFVLANRYRSGDDCVGWHADDERGLAPVIASLSLGETRVFCVKPKVGGPSVGLPLEHGGLVVMWGRCQRDFKHALPRTARSKGERVNLTLRCVAN